jgi:large subunit ribosomal protein L17
MPGYRKLGRPSDQRNAMLRNQVTELLWHGKIKTTEARGKEVRSIAEKLITLAVKEFDKSVTVTKEMNNEKGQIVTKKVVNDLPSKLNARRKMMSYLYDYQEVRGRDESKGDYRERTKDSKHPLIEKMFREYGPKYRERNEKANAGGGYTRILKLGPRRGDGAEEVIVELV